MSAAVTVRRRRIFALLQLVLFAFSAGTPLLPCAVAMTTGPSERAVGTQHDAPMSHASHGASHGSSAHHGQDAPESTAPGHHAPTSPMSTGTCPWVVGCTGMMQLAFETSWRVAETTPVVAAPVGVTLRPATVARDVASPPPRA